jgi:hypothetical protein
MSPRTLRPKNAHEARVATNDKKQTAPIGIKGSLDSISQQRHGGPNDAKGAPFATFARQA